MQHDHRILDMSAIGMIFKIVKTAAETKGASLEMEWQLLPESGGTPVHIHPGASESYRVIEGELEVYLHDRWQVLRTGEELIVPRGTPHTFRNSSQQIARVYNTHAPALAFQQYFNGLARVVKQHAQGNSVLRMNFTIATKLSMLMRRHKAELVPVRPPAAAVALLNLAGKLRGLKI